MWIAETAVGNAPAVRQLGTSSLGMGDVAFGARWADGRSRGEAREEQARQTFVIWTSVLATGSAALIYALLGS